MNWNGDKSDMQRGLNLAVRKIDANSVLIFVKWLYLI